MQIMLLNKDKQRNNKMKIIILIMNIQVMKRIVKKLEKIHNNYLKIMKVLNIMNKKNNQKKKKKIKKIQSNMII